MTSCAERSAPPAQPDVKPPLCILLTLTEGCTELTPSNPALPTLMGCFSRGYQNTLTPNNDLSLKQLSRKLTMLLALTAPKRCSVLQLLDIRFMRLHPKGAEFSLPGLTKTSCQTYTL